MQSTSSRDIEFIEPKLKRQSYAKDVAKQMPSSRLSQGMIGRVQDIVAIFPQGEPEDPFQLCLQEHVNRTDKKVFMASSGDSSSNNKSDTAKHVGIEETAGDGFEYVLAIVDKKSGKPIEFRPTALINFQPRFRPDKEILADRKRKIVDYSKDFSSTDNLYDERRRLTANFGSSKKNKLLDAKLRRSITNETLKAMTSTAFSSANANAIATKIEGGVDSEERNKEANNISILEKGSSSVLPTPNYNAQVPSEVYKLEQFMPKKEEIAKEFEAEAIRFFKGHENFQSLVHSAISPMVAKRIGTPLRYANPGWRCFLALKMMALSKFVQLLFKGKFIKQLSAKDLDSLEIPSLMLEHLRTDYLGITKASGFQMKLQVSGTEKHRILADLLCLMLLFDEPEFILPISPLVQELGPGENTLKSLLTGLGCIVIVASEAQALSMNTVRVAKLTGPPKKESKFFAKSRGGKQKR